MDFWKRVGHEIRDQILWDKEGEGKSLHTTEGMARDQATSGISLANSRIHTSKEAAEFPSDVLKDRGVIKGRRWPDVVSHPVTIGFL